MCAHGDRPKGKNGTEVPSQEWDQIFKDVSCFSDLTTLRFRERSELRIFGRGREKKGGIFRLEGFSPGTVEGECLAVFSFCQAPLALSNFTRVCCVPLRQTWLYSGYQK